MSIYPKKPRRFCIPEYEDERLSPSPIDANRSQSPEYSLSPRPLYDRDAMISNIFDQTQNNKDCESALEGHLNLIKDISRPIEPGTGASFSRGISEDKIRNRKRRREEDTDFILGNNFAPFPGEFLEEEINLNPKEDIIPVPIEPSASSSGASSSSQAQYLSFLNKEYLPLPSKSVTSDPFQEGIVEKEGGIPKQPLSIAKRLFSQEELPIFQSAIRNRDARKALNNEELKMIHLYENFRVFKRKHNELDVDAAMEKFKKEQEHRPYNKPSIIKRLFSPEELPIFQSAMRKKNTKNAQALNDEERKMINSYNKFLRFRNKHNELDIDAAIERFNKECRCSKKLPIAERLFSQEELLIYREAKRKNRNAQVLNDKERKVLNSYNNFIMFRDKHNELDVDDKSIEIFKKTNSYFLSHEHPKGRKLNPKESIIPVPIEPSSSSSSQAQYPSFLNLERYLNLIEDISRPIEPGTGASSSSQIQSERGTSDFFQEGIAEDEISNREQSSEENTNSILENNFAISIENFLLGNNFAPFPGEFLEEEINLNPKEDIIPVPIEPSASSSGASSSSQAQYLSFLNKEYLPLPSKSVTSDFFQKGIVEREGGIPKNNLSIIKRLFSPEELPICQEAQRKRNKKEALNNKEREMINLYNNFIKFKSKHNELDVDTAIERFNKEHRRYKTLPKRRKLNPKEDIIPVPIEPSASSSGASSSSQTQYPSERELQN